MIRHDEQLKGRNEEQVYLYLLDSVNHVRNEHLRESTESNCPTCALNAGFCRFASAIEVVGLALRPFPEPRERTYLRVAPIPHVHFAFKFFASTVRAGSAWLVTFPEGRDHELFGVSIDNMGGTSPFALVEEVGAKNNHACILI